MSRVSSWFSWVETHVQRYRVAVALVVHAALFTLGLLLAFLVRFDIAEQDKRWANSFLQWLPYYVALKLVIFWRMKLLRGGWRYTSIRDMVTILLALWVFVLTTYVLMYATAVLPMQFMGGPVIYVGQYFNTYSRGVLLLDFMATVFLVCTARLGFRIYREELRPASTEGVRRVLIVGAGDAAEAIIREIFRMREERYRVVGLVDDDPVKRGILIHGIAVLGTTEDIRRICQEEEVDEIIIAIPSATQKQLRRVIDLCSGTNLKFQSLPSVSDLINGRMTVSQIRPVDINDLLGREQVELDAQAVAKFIQGRRVLVTGAGGSIGSEMCRQISRYGPAELILVEQAENPLFDISNELAARLPQIPLKTVICDIYDRKRVLEVWRQHRPEVVIHAAAHKHVPLMECNPYEAVKNNVLGTRNVADASCQFGTQEFVMISTDKAVNPSSVMGATKRVAEMYTQALNGRQGCPTQFKAVRFGNVLGSAGSVVPTFRRQIAEGGPVRVTHPEMTRYFMTIPEASQLVLQAAATGAGGQIFLLDMGEPVKIVDLARQMITLSGFRPGEDIDIVFSGVRPGEKLFEELRTEGEDIEPTVHPKVLVWRCRSVSLETISQAVADLEALDGSSGPQEVIRRLKQIIPEFEPPQAPGNGSTRQEDRPKAPDIATPL